MNLDDARLIKYLWQDPVARTEGFFGKKPFYLMDGKSKVGHKIPAYQLGTYLMLWGELYGFREDPRVIAATGRGTGKTTIFQELNAADMACFMPYFLQLYYGTDKPIDVTIVFLANQKRGSLQRLDKVKAMISGNPYFERHLVDKDAWKKDEVHLKNNVHLWALAASPGVRGFHSDHPKGKVIYLCDEFAFWGGTQCMDGQKFVEEIAEQSFGASIGCFTTPYGQRGGAWWAYKHPNWQAVNFPTWMNPRADRKKLAEKVKRLLKMGRQIIVDQEIRGLFVIDVGLFFSQSIWLKSTNAAMEWDFDNQHDYHAVLKQLKQMAENREKKKGYYLIGADPNKGTKRAGSDPFGLNITQKLGRKFFNRFATAYNGRSQEEIAELIKLICRIYEVKKINFDGGGGYNTGPVAMIKGHEGVTGIGDIPNSNPSIVGYMSTVRSLMEMGRYEQPPDQDLTESQMAMKAIGDIDEGLENSVAFVKLQTDKKQFGIPCDLCAMGLALSRESVSRSELSMGAEVKTGTGLPDKQVETTRVHLGLSQIGDMGLTGIRSRLTTVGN